MCVLLVKVILCLFFFNVLNQNSAIFLQLFIKNIALSVYSKYLLPTDLVKWPQYPDCAKVA